MQCVTIYALIPCFIILRFCRDSCVLSLFEVQKVILAMIHPPNFPENFLGFSLCMLHAFVDVEASIFLGVRKIFARIFPNSPVKLLCDFFPQIFSHKDRDDHFWCDLQKKVFICFSANLGHHILKSNNFGRHFCPDFKIISSPGHLFIYSALDRKFYILPL